MTSAAAMPDAVKGKLPDYESFIEPHSDEFDWPVLDERTASSLCYTSGTTGNPKGVLYSHRSNVLHAYGGCMADSMGLSGRDSVLAVVPMFHANSWGLAYNAPMTGAKLVFPGPKMGDPAVLAQLHERGASDTGGWRAHDLDTAAEPPATDGNEARDADADSDRRFGGPTVDDPGVSRRAWRHGRAGLGHDRDEPARHGQHAAPGPGSLPLAEQFRLRALAGHGIFGVAMKVVDGDGHELPWDGKSSGELKVRGPWVCSGYFRQESSSSHDEDGWFATGDVAVIHPNGFMQITDRAKDVIKSGGEWISSVDLENCACGHPDVLMAAAIGVRPPEVGRAAAAARRAATRVRSRARLGARAPCRALREVAAPGRCDRGRQPADDGDRQDRQEGPAREVRPGADAARMTGTVPYRQRCRSASASPSRMFFGTG